MFPRGLGFLKAEVVYGVLEAFGGQLPRYTHILAAGYTNNFNIIDSIYLEF